MADAGYESLENYLSLEQNSQTCFIKPTNYDQKSKKFQKQIGRVENMTYHPEEDCFTRARGRKLTLRRKCTEVKDGQLVPTARYQCEDCRGCPHRAQYCRAKDPDKPKEILLKKLLGETGT